MAKSIEEIIQDKLVSISDALEVPVNFVAEEGSSNQVKPAFNPDDMISKFVALFVYAGVNMPSTMLPGYNRVHADVEFWIAKLKELSSNSEPKTETDGGAG